MTYSVSVEDEALGEVLVVVLEVLNALEDVSTDGFHDLLALDRLSGVVGGRLGVVQVDVAENSSYRFLIPLVVDISTDELDAFIGLRTSLELGLGRLGGILGV